MSDGVAVGSGFNEPATWCYDVVASPPVCKVIQVPHPDEFPVCTRPFPQPIPWGVTELSGIRRTTPYP